MIDATTVSPAVPTIEHMGGTFPYRADTELRNDAHWAVSSIGFYRDALEYPNNVARAITEEAWAENARRNAAPIDPETVVADRTAQGRALLAMRTREAVVVARNEELERLNATQQARINNLLNEQISGNDPRLSNFWAEAQEIATDADYCEIFDNLSERLGGPRRNTSYDVTLTISRVVTVTVPSGSDETSTFFDAVENAFHLNDLTPQDWDDVEVSDWEEID